MSEKIEDASNQSELVLARQTVAALNNRLRARSAAMLVNTLSGQLVLVLGWFHVCSTQRVLCALSGLVGASITSAAVNRWRDAKLRRELRLES